MKSLWYELRGVPALARPFVFVAAIIGACLFVLAFLGWRAFNRDTVLLIKPRRYNSVEDIE